MAATSPRRYSCETAAETLDWMNAIAAFLLRFRSLIDAHVVNFFKDRLWESIDSQWMECLTKEPIEILLGIPTGLIQGATISVYSVSSHFVHILSKVRSFSSERVPKEYWPPSLREFVVTLRSLVLPREQNLSHVMLEKFHVASLNSVLSQGMNSKKKHEVEILSAATSTIAHGVNSKKIIDVGSGQGYLAQVLSFEYQLSVVAIDSSLHHSAVTSARADRIKKHYAAKLNKLQHGDEHLKVPQTVTLQVLSSDSLAALSIMKLYDQKLSDSSGTSLQTSFVGSSESGVCTTTLCNDENMGSSSVLAGLHACGDLSVNMLRAFVDCEQVKALISVGCCYNLLTEESFSNSNPPSGFPLSNGAKFSGFNLGIRARHLACQSAERWKSLTKNAALQNFELHAFRAAFQMVLDKYYPEVAASNPSIGRQGKAMRRQQMRRVIESQFDPENPICSCNQKDVNKMEYRSNMMQPVKIDVTEEHYNDSIGANTKGFQERSCCFEEYKDLSSLSFDKYVLFKEFSKSGLDRLGFESIQDVNLLELWAGVRPYFEFIGPYWTLRAALGPLLETYILLDRLLFLQEHGDLVEAWLVPLFDPTLSPRNVAVMARKIRANMLESEYQM